MSTKKAESDNNINLLNQENSNQPKGRKIFKLSRFILYLFVILLIAFFVFSYQVLFTDNSISQIFAGKVSIFKQLNTLAGSDAHLKGEADDRINLLLLGMGGPGHDGPYLTDTIILASIQPSTKKIAMISIPRDLLVEIPGYGWWKINNANAFGEQNDPGEGGKLAKEVIEKTFDIPIHYYLRVDFAGFEKFVDEIGGIKVEVERDFTDYQYPAPNYKYQVVSFEQGWQTMDGDAALKYVRSRHGNNGEGSDFARSRRQQKVISAIKERLLSYNFFLNPKKIQKFSKNLADHVKTNMELWESIQFTKMAKSLDTENVVNQVIDDSPTGYLYANIVNEAYVLQPRGGDFSEIQYLMQNIFNPPEKRPEPKIVKIEIRNGTSINGLASINSESLKLKNFRVTKIANAPSQDYKETVIYKLSNSENQESEQVLTEKYNIEISDSDIPTWVTDLSAPDTDYFIVLGKDAE